MGNASGLPERLPKDDEQIFPNMTEYEVASPRDETYNCIAFAAGDTARKCDPNMLLQPGYYWPPGALRDDGNNDISALKRVFAEIGYVECDHGDLQAGYQKVALYAVKEDSWQHAALQDATGNWLSKLGDEYDVSHKSPHCFEGSIYGSVVCFMRRSHAIAAEQTRTQ